MQAWIKNKKGEPKPPDQVLVAGVYDGRSRGGLVKHVLMMWHQQNQEWRSPAGGAYNDEMITHWVPIPPLPGPPTKEGD